jgi:hypothetical protein
MAGFRISTQARPDPTPKAKARKNGSYLAFIRSLPCAVSGSRSDIEAAHLSFACTPLGHYGRGRGTKVGDRWCLPLTSEAHRQQHSGNEKLFWARAGIDPHILALAIFGLWSDLGDDAHPFATAIINQRLASAGRLRERITS